MASPNHNSGGDVPKGVPEFMEQAEKRLKSLEDAVKAAIPKRFEEQFQSLENRFESIFPKKIADRLKAIEAEIASIKKHFPPKK